MPPKGCTNPLGGFLLAPSGNSFSCILGYNKDTLEVMRCSPYFWMENAVYFDLRVGIIRHSFE